jgi:hypothetical protein
MRRRNVPLFARTCLAAAAAAALGACTAEPPVAATGHGAAASVSLAAALEGRSAGAPQRCVPRRDLRGNRSVGEGAILFDGVGGTLWVNRPPAGCPDIRPGRALVVRSSQTQLCEGDIAVVVDPVSNTEFGACGLGSFEPWRRTR